MEYGIVYLLTNPVNHRDMIPKAKTELDFNPIGI